MEIKNLVLSLLALASAAGAQADAFKCRAADGTTVISNVPCQAGSRTEAVQRDEPISPEQRRRAEQELERQQKLLAEREAARSAAEQREQESQRRQAEEASERQAQCLQAAQREPDPQLRAGLVAACTGTPPPQPVVVPQPVYLPVPATRHRQTPPALEVQVGNRPQPPEPPARLKPPCRPGTDGCGERAVARPTSPAAGNDPANSPAFR